ncbi:hypothetical protein P171DRAFT_426215 [Karstenula rhodostoma CBS 690.94]|uniref:Uncharacterized protein n=1 Tax=Karstenula rhodostoma CBS 690.94 TaxID=1392251 RepID=A0A9P4UJW2_9PLEO|nr:hypothetical protein P171DRAFT_426215 [Karstenula rhodostoma CBS 690.94]
MRSILLPTLGTVLVLGVSGARVSCDTKHDAATNSSVSIIAKVTEDCIADFCATGINQGTISGQCGPIVLTITPLTGGALLSDAGDCVGQFQNIINQCIATDGVLGGASQTDQLVYDLFVDESEGRSDRHTLEARRGGRSKTRKRPAAVPKTKTRTRKGKSRPKTTPKKGTTAKPKPKKPKACPLPKQTKGTKGQKAQSGGTGSTTKVKNIVRDIENFVPLPQVAKRMLRWFAAGVKPKGKGKGKGKATGGGGGKKKKEPVAEDCAKPYNKWYKEHTLYHNSRSKKVMWWIYRSNM